MVLKSWSAENKPRLDDVMGRPIGLGCGGCSANCRSGGMEHPSGLDDVCVCCQGKIRYGWLGICWKGLSISSFTDPSYSALSPLIRRTDSNFTHPCPLLPCRPRALSHRVYLCVIHCMLVRAKLLPYDAPHAARLLSNTR